MAVRKPSDRAGYFMRQRPYQLDGFTRWTSPVLVEMDRREVKEMEARQGPMLTRFQKVDAYSAHQHVKAGLVHETGLWTDHDDYGRERIRYACSDPMMEEAA